MNSTLAYPKNAIRAKTFREYAEYGDTEMPSSNKWNPNVPFHCSQEEFLEHIRSIEKGIEEGKFSTAEEHKKKHEQWKKEYLASRI